MLESCQKHPHEMGVDLCRRCGGSWCSDCLVYTHGDRKPPFCTSCAMVAGGVRTSAALPAMSRRQFKAQMKAMKAAERAAAAAEAEAAEAAARPKELAPDLAEALRTTDWSTPWWEDNESHDRESTLAD